MTTLKIKLKNMKIIRDKSGRFLYVSIWKYLKIQIVKGIKFLLKIGMLGGIGYALFMAGAYFNPVITYATQEVKVPVDPQAPVLDRIAKCESRTGQFNPDGSVVTNTNKNGTVDVGKYQINMSADHIKELAKLGLNPLTEEGNEAYAKYLYLNRGTGDWSSSASCWNK